MIRILLADDQEGIRSAFRMILGSQPDMEVVAEAPDGVTAVALARELRPDVVLADIRMPGLDGLEVTRLLAGPGVADPLRVVVVTTFDLDEYVHAALRDGACGFLLKRSGPALLVEAVRAAVAGDTLISPQITVRLLSQLGATGLRLLGGTGAREADLGGAGARPADPRGADACRAHPGGADTRPAYPGVVNARSVDPGVAASPPRQLRVRPPNPDPSEPLTIRELDVTRLVAHGGTNAEIAADLYLSPGTVKNHIASVQRKLGVANRVGIAAWAWAAGHATL